MKQASNIVRQPGENLCVRSRSLPRAVTPQQRREKVDAMQRSDARIGLLDHIGGGNLGDDATQTAVIPNIKKRWPGAAVSLFSMNPVDSSRRHGLRCYPIARKTWEFGYGKVTSEPVKSNADLRAAVSRGPLSRLLRRIRQLIVKLPVEVYSEMVFLIESFRTVKTLDLLIINGGGQLTGWCGPWSFPYRIFKWVLLARLARIRCFILNVGAGPLSDRLSRFFAARALRTAAYVSFRDSESQALARQIGFFGQSHVLPDNVYSLDVPLPKLDSSKAHGGLVVGLSPKLGCRPIRSSYGTGPGTYSDYVEILARFACWLGGKSYSLALFGTDVAEDPLAIQDLEKEIRKHRDNDRLPHASTYSVKSLDELLSVMATMDYVVTSRFHGIIFAHLLNKPVLAISPHPKVKTLMKDLDLSAYCLDAGDCELNRLTDIFTAMVRNADAIRSRMADRLSSYRSQLTVQFDQLFPTPERSQLS